MTSEIRRSVIQEKKLSSLGLDAVFAHRKRMSYNPR